MSVSRSNQSSMGSIRQILWLLAVSAVSLIGNSPSSSNSLFPPRQRIASYNDEQSATLRWEVVPGARYYRLQISEQQDFRTIRTDALLLQGKSWVRATVAGLEPSKTYWWRVQAIGDSGSSPWSTPVRLSTIPWTVGVPRDRIPTDGSVLAFVGSIRLSWQPCEGATSYRVQLSTRPDFDRNALERESSAPSVEVTGLEAGQRYYWRVCARRGSEIGQWSPVQHFSLLSLGESRASSAASRQPSTLRMLGEQETAPVELLPNPVSEVLVVRSPLLASGARIALYDVLGRQVLSFPVHGSSDASIPVGHLAAGSYTLVIDTSQNYWVGTVEVLR
jgi:hypothetical protein